MVMTILEASVIPAKQPALVKAYQTGIENIEPGIVETFLVQNSSDPNLWRIITLWQSREALEAMRRTGKIPTGVKMFQSADAQPVLSIYEVVAQAAGVPSA